MKEHSSRFTLFLCRRLFALSVFGLVPLSLVHAKPLKVFILAGQSNMQGHAKTYTLEHLGMDPNTESLFAEVRNEDGAPVTCERVWISSLSTNGVKRGKLSAGYGATNDKIGPEFTFGITMEKALNEPILLIKTAWGGKSLHTDFRPPGSGPYEFTEQQIEKFTGQGKDVEAIKEQKVEATGLYYRLMLDHVQQVLSEIESVYPQYDSTAGYELAGFVWFQGWNDMVDSGTYPNRDREGGYDAYSEVMAQFIRDVRADLSAPEMPFVIGVLGVNGPVENYGPDQQRFATTHGNFREAMAAPAKLPEFAGNVVAVRTGDCWDSQLGALVRRDAEVKREAKKIQTSQGLKGKEAQVILEELRAKEFSLEEQKIIEVGISNQAYHYLGSGKIMALIGEAFAEALLRL